MWRIVLRPFIETIRVAHLSGKTILILSPQSWGKMFVSKHHYAIELAECGNKVFFLNPPQQNLDNAIQVTQSELHENLYLINHRLFFPYVLKFRFLAVFHLLIRFQIKRILRRIGPIDIVWSFDIGNLYPLHFFGRQVYKIFHPVDEPLDVRAIRAAQGADIIFSVTREILEKYSKFYIPKHFINHGVSKLFLNGDNRSAVDQEHGSINVGFSGNLLRNDIDRNVLLEVINENPSITFHFWGSYTLGQSNIGGGVNPETKAFISALAGSKNVRLHGVLSSTLLASGMKGMSAFLICYDVQRDQSRGTNYHKVLEYLATGKVIISNNVSTYVNYPMLVQMVEERANNKALPALFKSVISNLDKHNSPECQKMRIDFARSHSYDKQIDRIQNLIYGS